MVYGIRGQPFLFQAGEAIKNTSGATNWLRCLSSRKIFLRNRAIGAQREPVSGVGCLPPYPPDLRMRRLGERQGEGKEAAYSRIRPENGRTQVKILARRFGNLQTVAESLRDRG